jgi:hypothetical protein
VLVPVILAFHLFQNGSSTKTNFQWIGFKSDAKSDDEKSSAHTYDSKITKTKATVKEKVIESSSDSHANSRPKTPTDRPRHKSWFGKPRRQKTPEPTRSFRILSQNRPAYDQEMLAPIHNRTSTSLATSGSSRPVQPQSAEAPTYPPFWDEHEPYRPTTGWLSSPNITIDRSEAPGPSGGPQSTPAPTPGGYVPSPAYYYAVAGGGVS